MSGVILTESNPRSPRPVAHPAAYRPGAAAAADRGAEYGAPSTTTGVVSWSPQHAPGHADDAGHDEPAPTLADVIGPAPAIGEVRR
jgi:hypothetical protein